MKYTKQNIANWLRMINQFSHMPRYDMTNFPHQEDADFTLRMIDDGYITVYEIRRGPQGEPKQFYGVKITTKGDDLMRYYPFKKTVRQKFNSINPNTWKVLAYIITTAIAAIVATVQVMNYFYPQPKAPPTVIVVPAGTAGAQQPKPAAQENQPPATTGKSAPEAATSPVPAGKP